MARTPSFSSSSNTTSGRAAACLLLTYVLPTPLTVFAAPPYSGTAFVDPNIITASDPSVFSAIVDKGRGLRNVFDRRTNTFGQIDAYLFEARGTDGSVLEAQINPEFGSAEAARVQAQRYTRLIGQLPIAVRRNVQNFAVHQGDLDYGGNQNGSLLIHAGRTASYESSGALEEILVHEASHTSLDALHQTAPAWLAAQAADKEFISTYARDNPTREDLAESFLMYLATRDPQNRVNAIVKQTVKATMPNRIVYFDVEVTLDWAQRTYPQIFPTQGQTTQSEAAYRYRAYPGGHYLAVETSITPQLLYLGPLSSFNVLNLGPLATWAAMAVP